MIGYKNFDTKTSFNFSLYTLPSVINVETVLMPPTMLVMVYFRVVPNIRSFFRKLSKFGPAQYIQIGQSNRPGDQHHFKTRVTVTRDDEHMLFSRSYLLFINDFIAFKSLQRKKSKQQHVQIVGKELFRISQYAVALTTYTYKYLKFDGTDEIMRHLPIHNRCKNVL